MGMAIYSIGVVMCSFYDLAPHSLEASYVLVSYIALQLYGYYKLMLAIHQATRTCSIELAIRLEQTLLTFVP